MAPALVEVAFDGHLHYKPPANRKKVAIVGFAPTSMMMAPFDDHDWEIWGVNEIYLEIPRIDRLFELHDHKYLTRKERNPYHLQWLRQATIPIYTFQRFKDIKSSVPFPWMDMVKAFQTKYFTNTIAWMVAFAVTQGFEKIALYGIDMSRSEEYRDQRPSCEYFIGVARGMGIDVFIPEESSLLRSAFLYGKEEEKRVEMDAKLHAHKDELVAKRTNIVNSVEALITQQHQVEGSIASLDYIIKEFMPVDDF